MAKNAFFNVTMVTETVGAITNKMEQICNEHRRAYLKKKVKKISQGSL